MWLPYSVKDLPLMMDLATLCQLHLHFEPYLQAEGVAFYLDVLISLHCHHDDAVWLLMSHLTVLKAIGLVRSVQDCSLWILLAGVLGIGWNYQLSVKVAHPIDVDFRIPMRLSVMAEKPAAIGKSSGKGSSSRRNWNPSLLPRQHHVAFVFA
jgi:hypothetical protein